ncbi:MAG: YkgJ family cysteine cluster protein [Candidatus Anstonellaceae archaeon]
MEIAAPCKDCKVLCCEKFIIPLTIFDIERIKNKTKLPAREFCELINYNNTDDKLFWPIYFLDKKNRLEEKLIVLKRNNDACIFLNSKKCKIWGEHPAVCKVYPFFYFEQGEKIEYVKNFICPRKWSGEEIEVYRIKEHLKRFKKEIATHNKIIRKWNANYATKTEEEFFNYIKKEFSKSRDSL